jgi:acyl dehydratase
MTTRALAAVPRLLPEVARTVVQALPVVGKRPPIDPVLPDLTVRLQGLRPTPRTLGAYRDVCGFTDTDPMPLTYPHVVAFPLHLALLNDPRFPFAAMGLVHVANSITVHGVLSLDDTWDLTVRPGGLRPHRRGQVFEVVTEATDRSGARWVERSALLVRGAGRTTAETDDTLPQRPPVGTAWWTLPAGLGRRYARVSRDANPIHLSALTARPFGFRRPIAHGMWTLARSLAELHEWLPDRYTVRVAFRKPISLPGRVRFGASAHAENVDFGVSSADGTVTHLVGRAGPVPAAPGPRPTAG